VVQSEIASNWANTAQRPTRRPPKKDAAGTNEGRSITDIEIAIAKEQEKQLARERVIANRQKLAAPGPAMSKYKTTQSTANNPYLNPPVPKYGKASTNANPYLNPAGSNGGYRSGADVSTASTSSHSRSQSHQVAKSAPWVRPERGSGDRSTSMASRYNPRGGAGTGAVGTSNSNNSSFSSRNNANISSGIKFTPPSAGKPAPSDGAGTAGIAAASPPPQTLKPVSTSPYKASPQRGSGGNSSIVGGGIKFTPPGAGTGVGGAADTHNALTTAASPKHTPPTSQYAPASSYPHKALPTPSPQHTPPTSQYASASSSSQLHQQRGNHVW
jgi:hypothetical protein